MGKSDIPIDGLTVAEKLSLMERIWAEFERRPSEIPSPEWHGNVLALRLQAVEDGETEFVEWSDAKSRLQSRYA